MIKKIYKPKSFYCLLSIFLISFNGYYFFIHRNVGIDYYLKKIFAKRTDDIINSFIYIDLNEEYYQFNSYNSNSTIVFIGDSITKRFNIIEFSKNYNIINRGIFSDTTEGLLNRLDTNVNNLKIDKLFIMIGYNDLKLRTNSEILSNISKILKKAKAKKIYLQSLLPVESHQMRLNNRIIAINSQLKIMADDNNINFVDLFSKFKTANNYINPELTTDGIHPNYFGYRLWFSIIKPYII